MKRILIIAAHPDDEVLGCGGIIAKSREKSFDIKVVFIAEGSSCRHDDYKSELALNEIKTRQNYALNALKTLGVTNYQFYDLPCGRLHQIPIIEINKIIEKNISEFEPDTVFTHSENDANNDHNIVYQSSIMATRPTLTKNISKLFSYEVLSTSEWRFDRNFLPNYFFKISKSDLKIKCNALKEYKSEHKSFPFPRSKDGIITLAKFRGMQCGSEFAEAFKLIRQFA